LPPFVETREAGEIGMFGRDPLANPEWLIERVYAYAAYRIGEGADAEDVTSEVFERAVRYRDTYDARKGEPIAWLMGIARRCVDEARGALARRPHFAIPDVAAPGDLEEEAVSRLSFYAALNRLDARDRELLALHYGADLTARRIGEVLGLRTNTVQVALHRAIGRLRTASDQGTEERGVSIFEPTGVKGFVNEPNS
jgi:RNA polymerase sigma-70 factor, ECF subfamily